MARDQITPVKTSEMSTACGKFTTGSGLVLISTANGAYVKTGGSSNIDATRLLFVVTRKSSKQRASVGTITVVSGSSAGNDDFEPGAYSTARNLRITVPISTVSTRQHNMYYFTIPETARFKDTDGYIKFNFSTALGRNGSATQNCHIGCLYLKK